MVKRKRFKIENGKPIPNINSIARKIKVQDYIYPFKEMKVGQSFRFPIKDRYRVTASAHAPGVKKLMPRARFVSRRISEEYGRIWRVK